MSTPTKTLGDAIRAGDAEGIWGPGIPWCIGNLVPEFSDGPVNCGFTLDAAFNREINDVHRPAADVG